MNDVMMELRNVSVGYDDSLALEDVSMDLPRNQVIALIGPSGSGKSSLMAAMSRMLELRKGAAMEGRIFLNGEDLYAFEMRAQDVRRRVVLMDGDPMCFPRSIWDNVAWAPRIHGFRGNMGDLVESCLRRTGLWEELRDKLRQSALKLSMGQRQRLCMARSLAVDPEILLLDEPIGGLDPISSGRIEAVIQELKKDLTVVIATRDHLQAGRLADRTALFLPGMDGAGSLVEYDETEILLVNPADRRTEDYITGKHESVGRRS